MNTPEEARSDGRRPQASGSPGGPFLDVPSRLRRGQCPPREAPAPHSGFSFERSFGFIQTVIRDLGNAAAGKHRGPVPVVTSRGRKPG